MLSPRQNLIETIRGGNPDRFVKQFESFAMPYSDPFTMTNPIPFFPGDGDKTDLWGVTWSWPVNTPGMFPVHRKGFKVIEDIEEWDGTLKTPPLDFSEELWEEAKKDYDSFDRSKTFVGPMFFPGLFEQTHCLMGIDDALMAFYTEPEKMHRLIGLITDWNVIYAQQVCEKLRPDALIQHDDWGSASSTFVSPAMFEEFFLQPYKRLYKCYKDYGVEIIVHHSDSYAATLVPYMVEMGIDIWQGGTEANDIPALVKEYGGRISFMTGLYSSQLDCVGWSQEAIEAAAERCCTECGMKFFIPCQTQGAPVSTFEGVYEAMNAAIDRQSLR